MKQLNIIDSGIDWLTLTYSSVDLKDPEKRKILVNSMIAYVDPTLKPTIKGNAYESEFRFMMITSRFLLFQFRGWEWANQSLQILTDLDRIDKKIRNCFRVNEIELTVENYSRLDFQFTFHGGEDEVYKACKLNAGTGSYKEYYQMKNGQRIFRGYSLYASEYRIRLYNKTIESAKDPKKQEWLNSKIKDASLPAWRFEVQVDRGFHRYRPAVEQSARKLIPIGGDNKKTYWGLVIELFEVFNQRLKIKIINQFVKHGGDEIECDSLSESMKIAV